MAQYKFHIIKTLCYIKQFFIRLVRQKERLELLTAQIS